MDLDSLQRRIVATETVLVLLTIGAIAVADARLGPQFSLGPLYLIPVSYSALTHRLRTTIVLLVLCIVLRQIFGPLANSPDPWMVLLRDLAIAAVFLVVVAFLRRLGRERLQIFDLARRQRDELQREVRMAATVQDRLISLNDPPAPGFDIAAKTEPLRGVGGDYYDLIDIGERRWAVVIADVAGKGLPAALLMPALRFGMRSRVAGRGEPTERLRRLNDEFYRTTEPRHYGTLFYAQFEADDGRFTYVNAGHTPPLLIAADGTWRTLETGGPPIGLLENGDYQSEDLTLAPGSTLLLVTDGVTEAGAADQDELGIEPIADLLADHRGASANELLDLVFDRVHRHLGGRSAGDDTTVIAVRRPEAHS